MAGGGLPKVPLGKGWDECIEEHERPSGRRAYFPVLEPPPPFRHDWQEPSDWDDPDSELPF